MQNSQAEARCRRKDTGMDVMFERETITNGTIANLYCPDGFRIFECLTYSPWGPEYVIIHILGLEIFTTIINVVVS